MAMKMTDTMKKIREAIGPTHEVVSGDNPKTGRISDEAMATVGLVSEDNSETKRSNMDLQGVVPGEETNRKEMAEVLPRWIGTRFVGLQRKAGALHTEDKEELKTAALLRWIARKSAVSQQRVVAHPMEVKVVIAARDQEDSSRTAVHARSKNNLI